MPGYEPGMRVFLYPDGVDGAHVSGYDVHPKSALTCGVVGYAASRVLFYFDVVRHLSRVPWSRLRLCGCRDSGVGAS